MVVVKGQCNEAMVVVMAIMEVVWPESHVAMFTVMRLKYTSCHILYFTLKCERCME